MVSRSSFYRYISICVNLTNIILISLSFSKLHAQWQNDMSFFMHYLTFFLKNTSLFSPHHIHGDFSMSMLCNKIKIKININNDEPLKTIWKHTKEIQRGEGWGWGFGDIINMINLHFLYHYSNAFLTSSKRCLNSILKKLLKYIPLIHHFSHGHGVLVALWLCIQLLNVCMLNVYIVNTWYCIYNVYILY
jgi:hypothetical protein